MNRDFMKGVLFVVAWLLGSLLVIFVVGVVQAILAMVLYG